MQFLKKLPLSLRAGTLSLKTVLSIYFIPISVLPAIFVSFYATRLFEESMRETLERRASSERDAIIGEIDAHEDDRLSQARKHATNRSIARAMATKNREDLSAALAGIRSGS